MSGERLKMVRLAGNPAKKSKKRPRRRLSSSSKTVRTRRSRARARPPARAWIIEAVGNARGMPFFAYWTGTTTSHHRNKAKRFASEKAAMGAARIVQRVGLSGKYVGLRVVPA